MGDFVFKYSGLVSFLYCEHFVNMIRPVPKSHSKINVADKAWRVVVEEFQTKGKLSRPYSKSSLKTPR